MNAVILLRMFLLPKLFPGRQSGVIRLLASVFAGLVFLYANYGGAVPVILQPSTVLGPIATFALDDATTLWLFRLVNSITCSPVVVGGFAVLMNHILTRPNLTDIRSSSMPSRGVIRIESS